jgi:hypothetical protein
MQLLRLRGWFVKVIGRLRHFFKENETGFSYLFFSQTSLITISIFFRHELAGPFGKTTIHSPAGWYAIYTIILYYTIPLVFFLAAFLTFHYPKNKDVRFLFVFITMGFSLLIVAATIVS